MADQNTGTSDNKTAETAPTDEKSKQEPCPEETKHTDKELDALLDG